MRKFLSDILVKAGLGVEQNAYVLGTVGIGTSSPSSTYGKLTVDGGISTTDDTSSKLQLGRYSAGIPYSYIKMGTNSNGLRITNPADNEDLFTITSGGNVGIGTNSPNDLLTLQRNDGRLRFNTSAGTRVLYLGDDFGSGGFQQIYDSTGAVKVQFSAGVSYFNGGSVGIGTNNPGAKLEVDGSFNIKNGDGNITHFNYVDGSTNYVRGTTYFDTAPVYFTGGNVGIGTSSPISKLDIRGSHTSGYGIVNIVSTDSAFISIDSQASDGGLRLKYNTGDRWLIGIRGNDKLQFNNASDQPKIVVQQDGNVGIGTTSPSTLLDVGGEVSIAYNATYGLRFYNDARNNWSFIGNSVSGSSSANLRFGDATGEVMRITGGNVGIGITNPSYKLDVNGETRLGKLITTWSNSPITPSAVIYSESGYNTVFAGNGQFSSSYLALMTTGNMSYMGGNVGIGTTSPTNRLQIGSIGSSGYGGNDLAIGNGTQAMAFYQSATVSTWYTNTSFSLMPSGSGSVGNVGIGTTSPSAKLEISGFSTGAGLKLNYGNSSGTIEAINFIANGGANGFIGMQMVSAGVGDLWLGGSGGRSLTLYRDGNVGIGTSSPAYKLDVNGTGRFTGRLYAESNITLSGFIQPSSNVGYGVKSSNGTVLQEWFDGTIYNYGTSYFAGNVGIGTTSPTQKLSVQGNTDLGNSLGSTTSSTYTTRISGYAMRYDASNRYGNYGVLILNADSGWTASARKFMLTSGLNVNKFAIIRSVDSTTDPAFGDGGSISSGTADFVIDSNGLVGIGTTTPTAKLDVNGAQIIQSVAGFGTDGDQAALFLSNAANFGLSGNFSGYSRNLIKSDGGSLLTVGRWNTSLIGELSIESGSSGLIKFLAGASERMRITSGGNVGIGLTNPTAILHTSGNTKLGGGTFQVSTDQSFLSNYSYTFRDAVGINNPNSLPAASATTVMSIGSMTNGVSLITTGSIGVGTTTPNRALTVNGVVGVSSGTANVPQLVLSSDANGNYISSTYMGTSSYVPMIFETSGTEKMRITTVGNVGIGTTSPAYKTEVATPLGNYWNGTSFTGTTAALAISNTQAGGYDPNLLFRQADSAGTIQLAGGLGMVGTGPWTSGNNSSQVSDMYFLVRNNSGGVSERMRINSGGNVGIGTTSPSIIGTGIISLDIQGSSAGGLAFGPSGIKNYIYGASTMYVEAHTTAVFVTSGTEKMRITSAGNVGIGTSAPNYKLETIGNARISGNLSIGTTYNGFAANIEGVLYLINGSAWVTDGYGYANASATTTGMFPDSSNNITFKNNNSTTVYINSSGNVGIGTTNPAAKFQVTDASSSITLQNYLNGAAIFLDGVNGDFIGGDYFHILADGSSYLGVGGYAGGATPLNVSNNGNVGIGTTSPSALLQVNGAGGDGQPTLRLTSASSSTFNWASSTEYPNLTAGQTSIHLIGKANSQYNQAYFGYRHVSNGSSSNMVTIGMYAADYLLNILGNGNVGIGTTSPNRNLTVSGNGTLLGLQSNTAGGYSEIEMTANGTSGGYIFKLSAGNSIYAGAGSLNIYNSNSIGFHTAAVTNAMFIASANGNVGIGTTSPSDKLSVVGNVSVTSGDYRIYNGSTILSSTSTSLLEINAGGFSNVSITNGNVGIGTTSPSDGKLQVVSNSSNWGIYAWNQSANGLGLHIETNSYGTEHLLRLSSLSGAGGSNTVRMVVRADGNVGIGTTSPNARLTVVANDSSNPNVALRLSSTGYSGVPYPYTSIRFGSAYSSYPSWNLASIDAGYTGSSWGGSLLFYTNNDSAETNLTERMRITTGGSLLIGSTTQAYNPQTQGYLFGVKSNTTQTFISIAKSDQTLDSGGMIVGLDSSTGYVWMRESTNLSFGTNNTARVTIAAGGNVGIGTTSPSEKLTVTGDIGIYENGANRKLYISNSAGSTTVQVSPNGASYFNGGDVGIGTTSPSYRLHVKSSGLNSVPFAVQRAANTNNIFYVYEDSNGNGNLTVENSGGNTGVFLNSSGSSYFNGGNVGIGTTSPTSPGGFTKIVHINGGYASLVLTSTIPNKTWEIGVNSSSLLTFYDGVADRMVINTGGNVGIGTTSPNYKLDVYGGSASTYIGLRAAGAGNETTLAFNNVNGDAFIGLAGGANNIIVGTAAGDLNINNRTGGKINLSTTSANAQVTINANGSVGIGTTAPSKKLHIYESGAKDAELLITSTYADGYDAQITLQNTHTGGRIYELLSTNDSRGIIGGGKFVINDKTAGDSVARLVIDTSGNVGIGTTSPLSPLHQVAGGGNYTGEARFGGSSTAFGIELKYTQSGSTLGSIYTSPTYSSTDILFKLGAGSGNENQLVLKGNGNVGIGTTSPSYKLDVYGGTDILKLQSTGTDARINIGHSANGGYIGYTNLGTTSNLFYVTTGSGTIGSGFVMDNAGNVGIGTTSPSAKLQTVSSGLGDGGGIRITNSGAGGDDYRIWPTATVNGEGAGKLIFTNNGGNVLTLTSGGNVGIGTTNPIGPLTVSALSNGDTIFLLGRSSDNATRIDFYNNARSARLYTIASGNGAIEHYADANVPMTFATNGSERLRITAAGNVGIGTTSPADKLEVAGSIRATTAGAYNSISVYNTGATGGGGFLAYQNGVANGYFGVAGWYQGNSDTGVIIGTDSSSRPIRFFTNTERMRITGDGNVGIGTTSPTVTLQVDASGGGLIRATRTSVGSGYIQMEADGTNGTLTANNILYLNAGGSTKMTVLSGGNVGIGTTSPLATLQVTGLAANSGSTSANNPSGTLLLATDSGFNAQDYGSSLVFSQRWFSGLSNQVAVGQITGVKLAGDGNFGGGLTFWTSNTTTNSLVERVRITDSGNVGIGTTSPGYKLDVSGIINTTSSPGSYGTIIRIRDTVTSGTESFGGVHFTSSPGTDYTIGKWTTAAGVGLLQIRDQSGNQFVTINSSGNVGIGTTSPSEKLEVNGSIRLSDGNADGPQLKLASSGYSDWNIDNYNGSLRAYYGSTEYTRLTSSGYFGIGTSSPSYKLHVEGNVSGISIYASHDIAAFSDITVKKDVERIENAVDKVKELNGYTYVRTDDATGTRRAGVIAQEVQKVLPEVVSQNPDGTLNVAYANMIALLIEGMKEQQATIERMQQEINELKK